MALTALCQNISSMTGKLQSRTISSITATVVGGVTAGLLRLLLEAKNGTCEETRLHRGVQTEGCQSRSRIWE